MCKIKHGRTGSVHFKLGILGQVKAGQEYSLSREEESCIFFLPSVHYRERILILAIFHIYLCRIMKCTIIAIGLP